MSIKNKGSSAHTPTSHTCYAGPVLGIVYPPSVYFSLLAIVAGVALASAREVTFCLAGFNAAVASTLGMVMRGFYTKHHMQVWPRRRNNRHYPAAPRFVLSA